MVIGSAVKNYFGIGTAGIPHAKQDAVLFLFGIGPMHGRDATAEEDMLVEDSDGTMVRIGGPKIVADNDGNKFIVDGEKYREEPFFPTHEARRAHWFHQTGMAVPSRAVLLEDICRWKARMDAEKEAREQ
jgi:hypothetical protein